MTIDLKAHLKPANVQLRQEARPYLYYTKDKDVDKAAALYLEAAMDGDVLAQMHSSLVQWVYLKDSSYVDSGFVVEKVIPAIQKLADQGNAEAQYLYGWYGYCRQDRSFDYVHYWELAAKQGNVDACTRCGYALEYGADTTKDLDQARHWLELSAQGGDPAADYYLATIYQNPDYPKHDYAKGLEYYKKSSDLGYIAAIYAVGYCYHTGLGAPVDSAMTLKYYREAAALGDAHAYDALGIMYMDGDGVPRDYKESRRMLEEAVARDYPDATEALKYLDQLEKSGQPAGKGK